MVEVLLCVVGAFYAFASYVATRAALTSHFMDRAIAAIGATKPSFDETARNWWLLSAAALVLAGGLALVFLLDLAVWLFGASSLGQALYLTVLGPRYFDLADPPDPRGRRQSTNAFVIYLAATAFVVWAGASGKLMSVSELGALAAVPAAAFVAHVVYVMWTLNRAPAARSSPLFADRFSDGDDAGRDPSESKRIKVMADYGCHPLWALDEELYGDIAPEKMGLSPELTRDLNAWAEAYAGALDPDDPSERLWSEEQFAAHEAEARPLAVRLARERPDLMVYVMDPNVGVVEVHADEEPRSGGAGL